MQEQYYVAYFQAITKQDLSKATQLYLLNEDERSEYKGEYSAKTYDKYFGDDDPQDILQDILNENEEFYILLKQKIGELAGNYYVASYQATIEKNAKKATMLDKLSSEEKIKYSNEYPNLTYDDIFNNNDPNEVLNSFLENEEYKEFYLQQIDVDNDLATEENIAIREANYLELMNHPLINYCPNPVNGLDIINNLASVSFSTEINNFEFVHALATAANQSPIIGEMLSTIAISVNMYDDKQISIALIGDNIQEYDPTMEENDNGGFNPLKNSLTILNENQDLNAPTLVHELTHHSIHLLFKNMGVPYYKDSAELKAKYHQAIKSTLLNIKEFVYQKFNINISHIKNTDSTWEIGKKLYAIYDSLDEQIIEGKEQTEILNIMKQTDALGRFLALYRGGYNQNAEDGEFIVRLLEIITDDLYEDENIETFEPINQYWKEAVSEAVVKYQALNDYSNICLPLSGNTEFVMYAIDN